MIDEIKAKLKETDTVLMGDPAYKVPAAYYSSHVFYLLSLVKRQEAAIKVTKEFIDCDISEWREQDRLYIKLTKSLDNLEDK